MRLPRRERATSDDGDPVANFWEWWIAVGAPSAEAGIAGGGFGRFTLEMTARVQAIHQDLAWELSPGSRAQHALIVTAAGVPELRRRAEQWYQRSPAVSATWEYYPARQASPDSLAHTLEFGAHKLNLAELTFGLHVDNDRQRIDTVVFHPVFAQMQTEARDEVAFLALDWNLGEDGVTRWIGTIQAITARPTDGLPADGLTETVKAMASRAAEPRWALLSGERNGAAVLGMLAVPAKWIDHPLMDLHVAVNLPYADQTPVGLPTPDALDRLREIEEELTALLPPHATLVGHESSMGVRTLHMYADSDDRALADAVRGAVSRWPGAAVNTALDAGWRAIRHLTG